MMNKLPRLILFLLVLASCSTGLDRQMEAVLDQVEDDLGYVNTISPEDVAKMADWFVRRGDDGQKSRALYCLGRAQLNERNYPSATVTFTKALEYAVKAGDSFHEGLICNDIARTCGATGNSSDEMLYLARAAEAFRKAGAQDKSQFALLEIGKAKDAIGEHQDAEEIFKSVLYDSHEMGDTLLEVRCLEAYAALAVGRDNPDPALAIDLLGRAAGELHYPLTCSDKGILAYSYSLAGKKEEAARWLSEARSSVESGSEAADIDFREYQIASRAGETARALKALERVTDYGNKTQSAALEEVVAASQREYFRSQSEAGSQKLRSAKLRLTVLSLVALLVIAALAGAYIYYRSRQKRRLEEEVAEREKYMSIAEDLGSRLAAVESRRDFGQPKHPGPGFEALERLCEQYYVFEGTENLQPRILKEVKSIIEGLRSDGKAHKALEDLLDEEKDGVMTKLRKEFPSWKEEDYLLYSFAASGFSSTTISTLMEKEKSVIYNRVWRLKGRLSNSGSPLKDFFLECLEK